MASPPRTATSSVASKLERLAEEPYRFGFFATLRYFESIYSDKEPLGLADRPSEEVVRLGQEPSLAFAPSTLASFEPGSEQKPHRLSSYFLGLFGPHGPMPEHLTEYARDRERNFNDSTFRAFADVFHHRMLAFFYRAWAEAQPTVSLDRLDTRQFDKYVGALLGVAGPEFAARDSIDDDTKRYWVGRFSLGTRPADGLQSLVEGFFEVPFEVREFVGEWLHLLPEDTCKLGTKRENATLGMGAILGNDVWSAQHRFQLICGPVGFGTFMRFLPGGASLLRLRDLVRSYAGDEYAWDCNLVLRHNEVPELQLGRMGQLGWTTWIGKRQGGTDADDVTVDAFFESAKV